MTSMASAGAHRLLREQGAVCITDAAEAAELAGSPGQDLAPERQGHTTEFDELSPIAKSVCEALPLRSQASPESLARVAGLASADVLAGLGELELSGLATRDGAGMWRRVPSRTSAT